MRASRLPGTIRTLFAEKRFGFIAGADGREYFFHSTAVEAFDALRVGDAVVFIPGVGPKGPRADVVERARLDEDQAGGG